MVSRLLRASLTAEGDFDANVYRWLSREASAEEGAALEAELAAAREYRSIYQALAEIDAKREAALPK